MLGNLCVFSLLEPAQFFKQSLGINLMSMVKNQLKIRYTTENRQKKMGFLVNRHRMNYRTNDY